MSESSEPQSLKIKPEENRNSISSYETVSEYSISEDEQTFDSGITHTYPNSTISNPFRKSFTFSNNVNISRTNSLKSSLNDSSLYKSTKNKARSSYLKSKSDLQRSVSELELNRQEKKKLSLDLDQLEDAISIASNKSQISIFRSIGNWFRGSTRSQRSFSFKFSDSNETKELPEVPETIYANSILKTCNQLPPVGTAFTSVEEEDLNDLSHYEDDQLWEQGSSSDDSLSIDMNTDTDDIGANDTSRDQYEVTYEIRSSDKQLYRHLNRCFHKTGGISVTCKNISDELNADALIIPGNSFGFLDGEPEIKYVEIFGWQIQEQLRKKLVEDHDGELLVGQSVILDLQSKNSNEGLSIKQSEEDMNESHEDQLQEVLNDDEDQIKKVLNDEDEEQIKKVLNDEDQIKKVLNDEDQIKEVLNDEDEEQIKEVLNDEDEDQIKKVLNDEDEDQIKKVLNDEDEDQIKEVLNDEDEEQIKEVLNDEDEEQIKKVLNDEDHLDEISNPDKGLITDPQIKEAENNEIQSTETDQKTFSEDTSTDNKKINKKTELKKIQIVLEDNELLNQVSTTTITSGVRYLIYVPVMRVPSLVPDTANAYLAFRSAILAVKRFNSEEDTNIRSVICPPLCDGIGKMPAGRIAFQMKSAYDIFALGLNEVSQEVEDLGRLATNHVKMCSIRDGDWC